MPSLAEHCSSSIGYYLRLRPSIESCSWVDFYFCGICQMMPLKEKLRILVLDFNAVWKPCYLSRHLPNFWIVLHRRRRDGLAIRERWEKTLLHYITRCGRTQPFRLQPSINLHAPVTANIFSCSGTQCTTPKGWRLGISPVQPIEPHRILASIWDLNRVGAGSIVQISNHYTYAAHWALSIAS